MKNEKPKTLDQARTMVLDLEKQLAEQSKANNALVAKNIEKLVQAVQPVAKVAAPAVVKLPKRTEDDLNLPTPSETGLENEIANCRDYKKRWLLMRSLAKMQTTRAQAAVTASRGKPLGSLEIRHR